MSLGVKIHIYCFKNSPLICGNKFWNFFVLGLYVIIYLWYTQKYEPKQKFY